MSMDATVQTPSVPPSPAPKAPAKGIVTPTDEKLGPWPKDPVNVRLRGIRWRQRLFNLLTLLLGVLATLLLYIVLMMCADRIGEFEAATRQIWLGTSAMMLAVTAILMSAYFLASKFNPMHHAREVDRALGFDDDSLVTYVDLRRRRKAGPNEVDVAVLLQDTALERVERIDADQVIDARPLAAVLKVLGGTAAFLLILFLVWGRTFNDSFMRTVMPWRNVAPPRWTQIVDVTPGSGMTVAGEPVRFSCVVRASSIPDNVTLRYKMDGEARGVSEALNRIKSDTSGARYTSLLPGFARSVTYWIESGDAKAGPFRLDIAERPLIAAVNVRVHPPTYAPFAPVREVAGGHVQAVNGSRLEIVATATHPPRLAPLVKGALTAWLEANGQRSPVSVDGSTLTANVMLTRDFEYRLGFVDTRGLTSRDGVQYQARIAADKPPAALLSREDAPDGTPAPHNGRVGLRAEVSDDLGLAKVSLRLGILGGLDGSPLRTIDYAPLRSPREFKHIYDVRLEELNLREGDALECVLIAEDILRPKSQVTITGPVRIPIVRGEAKSRQQQQQEALEVALAERRLERPDQGLEKPRGMEELSADEQRLLRDLAELVKSKQDESTQGMRELTADELEKLADELAELAKDAEASAGEKTGGESMRIKKEGDAASDGGDRGTEGAGKDGAGSGKESKGGGESGKQGGSDGSQGGQSGRNGEGDSGGQKRREGSNGERGGESGTGGQNGGNPGGAGKNGKAAGRDGGNSGNAGASGHGNGQGGKSGGKEGPPNGTGNGAGSGGEGAGKPEGGNNGGGNDGDSKAAGGGPSNAGSSGSQKSDSPGGGGGQAREKIGEAAQELRDGKADLATLEKTRVAFDHLMKQGRSLSSADREKLKAAAEAMKDDPAAPRRNSNLPPEKAGKGRVRQELLNNTGAGTLTNRPGDMKEDELGRMIERGKAKIAPEYRKALEDYYKSLNK